MVRIRFRALVGLGPLLFGISGTVGAATRPASPPGLVGLDAEVAQALQDFKVPGVAIAVVKEGKVILAKGYGYRDLEKQLPVTAKTLFAIGSITKSFTVATLGTLVDEGRLGWDQPVHSLLPGFVLKDAWASEHVTPRDLVTHRTGLPRHDLTWYSADFSRAELVGRLRYLELSKEPRATFQYNNLMFMTAGYLAGQLQGTTWEEAVRQRILAPLGMNDSNFSVEDSQKSTDFARPYRKDTQEKATLIPYYVQGAVGPAGSINSSADDLARYMLFHLGKGEVGGKRVLSESNAVQMQTPQMVIQQAAPYPELGETSYGLGFFITTYRGHKFVGHGGNIDGFSAEVALFPNDGIGVAVLANLDGTSIRDVLPYRVFDRLLGLEPVPWKDRLLERERKFKASEEEARARGVMAPKPDTHPSHPLGDYAGRFEHPGYGVVTVTPSGDGLAMALNRLEAKLKHYHYDVFQVPANPLDPMEKTKARFETDVDGEVSSVVMTLEPSVQDIVFTRAPEPQMSERGFLEAFLGRYEVPGAPAPVTVVFDGDHALRLSLPGQPARRLLPRRGTRFDLEGLSGYALEFKKDSAGRVLEAIFYQVDTATIIRRLP